MIRCEMAGCVDMAGVIAECNDIIAGTVAYDLCEACADYLRDELAIIKVTAYANKGLEMASNDR
jgi:hypothetical protein